MSPRFCTLPACGCIAVDGRDARSFLHAQLSQDIAGLGTDRAPLAGWHDARGRVRALVRVLPVGDGWLLAAPRDSLAATVAGLARYVLRAEVRLAVAEGWAVGAALGDAAEWLAARGTRSPDAADALVAAGDGSLWVRAAAELWYVYAEAATLARLGENLPPASPADAALAAIRAGLPAVGAALAGAYVPQMLNLDVLGAISFTKGCYPGQEIIARTHHLGSVKRRMRRFAASGAALPEPRTPIVDGAGAEVGEVIRAAHAAADTVELLAVVPTDARASALFLADAPLTELPLPYALP